jgi:hypothetical protein
MGSSDIEIRAGSDGALPRSAARTGMGAALIAGLAVAIYGVVQILQIVGITSPPLDAIVIYVASLAIAPPFAIAMLALHYTTPLYLRFWSHAAVLFASVYVVFALLMYVVQLGSVVPYNATEPVLIDAPHSLFWTIDALAYLSMGMATAFALGAVDRRDDPAIWWFFLAHAVMTPVIAVVYFAPTFTIPLLLLASPWLVTACGAMLALAHRLARATA